MKPLEPIKNFRHYSCPNLVTLCSCFATYLDNQGIHIKIKPLQPIEKILPFICTIWVPKILFPYRKWIHFPHVSENHWKFCSFHYHNRNVNPIISKNGDGKNSLFVIQGTIIFPHSGTAVVVKKISPFAASPLMGKFFFTTPAPPFMGKYNCTFHDSQGIFISPTRGFAARKGNIPSPFFEMMGLAQ